MMNGNKIETKRVIILYCIGFLLVFGYAFARPCIDSIFLEHYSHDDLPLAWLLTSLASAFVIAFYNRLNQRYAILSLYGATSLVCAASLAVLLIMYFFGFTYSVFIMYIWKEIYMVVLMETYWSFADIVFSTKTARHTYGFAMAISSFGGVLGNLAVGPTANYLGTKFALCFLLLFLVLGYVISVLGKKIADEKPSSKQQALVGIGIKTLFASKYLVPLAFLACTIQVVTGLIDYKFNGMLQENILNTDMRTEMLGRIHAAVNLLGISIQLSMGPILRIFGIGATFKSIPFLLSSAILAFVLVPQFALLIAVKISNKALDYSLFRGVKEMLYIPLSREEKTQGKGLIDIFMYRLARGLSSLVLMALISLGLASFVMEFSLMLTVLWLVLASLIIKRYHAMNKRAHDHETSTD